MTELDPLIYERLVATAARVAEINHLHCLVSATEFDTIEVRYSRPGRTIGHLLPAVMLAQVRHHPALAAVVRRALERLAANVLRV